MSFSKCIIYLTPEIVSSNIQKSCSDTNLFRVKRMFVEFLYLVFERVYHRSLSVWCILVTNRPYLGIVCEKDKKIQEHISSLFMMSKKVQYYVSEIKVKKRFTLCILLIMDIQWGNSTNWYSYLRQDNTLKKFILLM